MAVYLPIGIVIGFFLASGIILAMGFAEKRRNEAYQRELLANLYGRESDVPTQHQEPRT